MIDKIDAENTELYLLDAVNCNLLPEVNLHISLFVTGILDINGRCQLITEPRGVTPVSKASSVCNLLLHSPEKVTNTGFVLLDISDHSLVFAHYDRNGPRMIETRQFTNTFKEISP